MGHSRGNWVIRLMKLELPVLPAIISFLILCGCNPQDDSQASALQSETFIKAADLSGYPEMEGAGVTFYGRNGNISTRWVALGKSGVI